MIFDSFYETFLTLMPETEQEQEKKETLQLSLTHEHRCKNPGENFVAKGSQQHVKRTTRSEGIGLTPGMQDWPFNGNVNQWTSPHTPNKGENPRGNLNRCR